MRFHFAEDLDKARYRWDAAAAQLASGGAPATLKRLLGRARGHAVAPETGPHQRGTPLPPPAPSSAAREALQRMARDGGDVAIAHVGSTGIAYCLLRADEPGPPRPVLSGELTWSDQAGAYDPADLAFALAGGVGTADGLPRPPELADRLIARLSQLGLPAEATLVLLPPAPQWPVPLAVAEALARRHRMVVWELPSDLPPDTQIDNLRRLAPPRLMRLERDYSLVLLAPDGDGSLRPVARPLFPAGTLLGGPAAVTAKVEILVPRRTGPLALAVVVADGDPASWHPATILRATLPPGRTRVEFTLDGPGRVRCSDAEGIETRTWEELLAAIPTAVGGTALDVVLAVELSDDDEYGQQRLACVHEILDLLAAQVRMAGELRVAVIGYGQHAEHRSPTRRPPSPLSFTDFGDPESTRRDADRLRLAPNRDDWAAAAEDMLDFLRLAGRATSRIAWRLGAQRHVVVLGRRPPYPASSTGSDHSIPCASRVDWHNVVTSIEASAIRVGVWQDPGWGELTNANRHLWDRLRDFWAQVGRDHCFEMDGAAANRVVDVICAAAPHRTMPFPVVSSTISPEE